MMYKSESLCKIISLSGEDGLRGQFGRTTWKEITTWRHMILYWRLFTNLLTTSLLTWYPYLVDADTLTMKILKDHGCRSVVCLWMLYPHSTNKLISLLPYYRLISTLAYGSSTIVMTNVTFVSEAFRNIPTNSRNTISIRSVNTRTGLPWQCE